MSIDLDRLEELALKAMNGPWQVNYSSSGKTVYIEDSDGVEIMSAPATSGEKHLADDTADYIAAVSPDVVLNLIWRYRESLDMSYIMLNLFAKRSESCVSTCSRKNIKELRRKGNFKLCRECIIEQVSTLSEEKTALKCCPCCGNRPSRDDVIEREDERPRVYCSKCGIIGPEAKYDYHEYAYKAWNALPRKTEKAE